MTTSLFPVVPVFMDLAGRAVVLLGAHPAFRDLAPRFATAGASVTVIDPAPESSLIGASGVRLVRRRWRAADLKGAALVIASGSDRRTARARTAAKSARAVFAALDAPNQSDVALGGGFSLGPVAVAVASASLPREVAAGVRRRLDTALPAPYLAYLTAVGAVQADTLMEGRDEASVAAFWAAAEAHAIGSDAPQTVEAWLEWLHRNRPAAGAGAPTSGVGSTL